MNHWLRIEFEPTSPSIVFQRHIIAILITIKIMRLVKLGNNLYFVYLKISISKRSNFVYRSVVFVIWYATFCLFNREFNFKFKCINKTVLYHKLIEKKYKLKILLKSHLTRRIWMIVSIKISTYFCQNLNSRTT